MPRLPVLAAAATAASLLAGPAAAASPAAVPGCSTARSVWRGAPTWAQAVIASPRVWPLTQGEGVRVAVLSTGVDARNAQFPAGALAAGGDVLDSGQSPDRDCDGRGTILAGLVAARPDDVTTFAGVAPRAQVVPIRVVETVTSAGGSTEQRGGTARELAAGIRLAVRRQAAVVCVPVEVSRDSAALRRAVDAATAAGVLVVAGGAPPSDRQAGSSDPASVHAYPAEYPGVLSVAAVDKRGAVLGPTSDPATPLDVAAPATEIVSTAPGSGLGHLERKVDAGAAAALVAGVAALVRAYRPQLTVEELHDRLVATGSPLAATGRRPGGSLRLVDPERAVTSDVVDPRPGGYVALAAPQPEPPAVTPTARQACTLALALLAATGAAVLVVLSVGGGRSRPGPRTTAGVGRP